jgi:hypothetical protein
MIQRRNSAGYRGETLTYAFGTSGAAVGRARATVTVRGLRLLSRSRS